MLENKFKTRLVKELKERFPGCKVVHLDPNEVQGYPDLLGTAAMTTRGAKEDMMHLIAENKEEVLNAMERSFEAHGAACFPWSQ